MREQNTIALANHRSSVGKTSTTLSLCMEMADRDMRVLMIDLDHQAGLSLACGVEDTEDASIAEVLGGSQPGELKIRDVLREIHPGKDCYLIPSGPRLAQTELGLNFRMGKEAVLRTALESISKEFDLILLDCPSSLGMLTINAMETAHAVLIPTRPEMADLRGVLLFLEALEKVKQEINPNLQTLGVLVTYYNPGLEHHRKAVEAMKKAGIPLLPVGIEGTANQAASQSSLEAKPINIPGDPETCSQLAGLVEQWLAGWHAWQPSIEEP